MTNANIIKSAVLSTLRALKVGTCLGLGGMAVLASLEDAQAQATPLGSNTGTLALTLTVSSSGPGNPNQCGFGTTATTAAGSVTASNTITAGSKSTYISDNSTTPSGTISAISVYCTAAFYVSAGGSQQAVFTPSTNYPAAQRFLYTSGTAAYPYYLVLGANGSPTTVPIASLWGGDGTTNCNDAFDGNTAGTGGSIGNYTKGCYKSANPANFTTPNVAQIPWSYYIALGSGIYTSWVISAGQTSTSYSDTVNLSLNY